MIETVVIVLSLIVSFKIIADLIEISESRNVLLGILKVRYLNNLKKEIEC